MATWSPISNSVPQFSKNAGGAAAADYYLKFYLSGTTTPTSMATDSTGGTLLDKCKIDSLGYPVNGSDEVFIPHIDQAYKLALYTNATDADNNATGSAAWVVDGLTFKTFSQDASNVTYTPAGTGAVATDVQTKLREVVSVLDHGAVGDGVTDDTAAIQRAVDSLSNGGTIYLPDGQYVVSDEITIAAGISVSFLGQSRFKTELYSPLTSIATGKAVIRYNGTDAAPCQNVSIKNLRIHARWFENGIYTEHCFPNLVIRDVEIFKPANYGFYLNDCWTASLYDCEVDGDNATDTYGYYVVNANNVCLYNCRVYNMKATAQSTGIGGTSAENFSIFGGNVENCPRGIYVTAGGTFNGPITIRDVYFEPRNMNAFDAGQPNDHIKILGGTARMGSAIIEGCLFQAGSASVPIAFNAISAQNIGSLTVNGNTWQKAQYTVGGEGENYFIDVDSTVGKVIEKGNTLISTSLGLLRQIPEDVFHEEDNVQDSGTNEPRDNYAKFAARIESTKTNVTGDGTVYTVIFETEDYDVGTNYDNTTGIFTAPYDGYYQFNVGIQAENLIGGYTTTEFALVTTSRTYMLASDNPTATKNASDDKTYGGSLKVWLNSGDTAKVTLMMSGGTLTADLKGFAGSGYCFFEGAFAK